MGFLDLGPGIIISIIGTLGLVFTLTDSVGEIGSKIPISVFFLFILIVGIVVHVLPKDLEENTFGEFRGPKNIG